MTPVKFASYIRRQTNTNSSTYTDLDLVEDANIILDEIADRANDISEDIFQEPIFADLEAGVREYAFPESIGPNFIRVEANFTPDDDDDPTDGYWILLSELDLRQWPQTTDEYTIVNTFANEQGRAFYDKMRQSLWLYSGTIVAVTNGLKFIASTYPGHITNLASTDDMAIDPSPTSRGVPRILHRVWADGVILMKKASKDKSKITEVNWANWRTVLGEKLSMLQKPNQSQAVEGSLPDSSHFDNGYDL